MVEKEPYEKVVDYLITQIEESKTLPWEQPWINKDCSMPVNIRGTAYRGVNVLNLMFTQMLKNYASNVWLTYKQASALKGNVRKGEKGVPIIFWKILVKKGSQMVESESEDSGDDEDEKKIPFIRVYTVFNADQCDLPKDALKAFAKEERTFIPIEEAARIIQDMKNKPNIFEDQIARAFYREEDDSVHIPQGKYFKKAEWYYSTMFHELVHSTGHKSRLNREGVARIESAYNKTTYSEEELVAELGSVFLCSYAQIEKEPAQDHVAYLQNWVKYLKDHKKSLIWAAQRAQKAKDFILAK